jgi:excinuclease UvrABC ATPase subunit
MPAFKAKQQLKPPAPKKAASKSQAVEVPLQEASLKWLELKGANLHNLQNVNVQIPSNA